MPKRSAGTQNKGEAGNPSGSFLLLPWLLATTLFSLLMKMTRIEQLERENAALMPR